MKFDRSPDLGVKEFRALSGGVTTWIPPIRPRRLRLEWSAMERDDVVHLDRLARRIDEAGPVAVIDPLARNVLSSSQGLALGDPAKWAYTKELALFGGVWSPYVENRVGVVTVGEGGPELYWQHPNWVGYPAHPGMVYTWWAPGLLASGAPVVQWRMEWYDVSGKLFFTSSTPNVAVPIVRTAPEKAAYVRPAVRFDGTRGGDWPMGQSMLCLGDVSAALVAGARPYGEGTPAYSITGYSHAATAGDGAFRDISLDLVEVT
ncbi:hypothetical protein [Streptomyces sp. NRRL B-1347]|uniref:hypothetical protein n=1 Tax=Streptomyces sp. NRRL B-1347 TaxID=1476877 RepID=UPI00131EBEE9|nr:hypothetical protein [Streptomyces sp. NRRL B-1347]